MPKILQQWIIMVVTTIISRKLTVAKAEDSTICLGLIKTGARDWRASLHRESYGNSDSDSNGWQQQGGRPATMPAWWDTADDSDVLAETLFCLATSFSDCN